MPTLWRVKKDNIYKSDSSRSTGVLGANCHCFSSNW